MKKKKFVSKYQRINTLDYVLQGIKITGTCMEAGVVRKIKNYEAFDEILKGKANLGHIDELVRAFNMAEALPRVRPDLGLDWIKEIKEAQTAIKTMVKRGHPEGKYLFTGPEMNIVRLALDLHHEQLNKCTVQEHDLAVRIVNEVVRQGKAEKILE